MLERKCDLFLSFEQRGNMKNWKWDTINSSYKTVQ